MKLTKIIFLTFATSCHAGSRKLAKSTKAPTMKSTKAPKSTKATSVDKSLEEDHLAVYGLQDDCHDDNPDTFNICLNLLNECGEFEDWMDGAIEAKLRWEKAIVKDTVDSFDVTSLYSEEDLEMFLSLTEERIPELVDDLYIVVRDVSDFCPDFIAMAFIDVVETFMRTDCGDPRNVVYTMSGVVFLNIEAIEKYGLDLETVMLHEIGHILGFGDSIFDDMVEKDPSENLHYVGTEGLAQWYKLGCTGKLPLEPSGIDFDEECLANELMTDSLSTGENPLSAITLGVMADLGYVINFGEADDFTTDDLGTCATDYCDISKRKLAPTAAISRPPLSASSWQNIYKMVRDLSHADVTFIEYMQDGFQYSVRVERAEALEYFAKLESDEDGE